MNKSDAILKRHDAGELVEAIAKAESCTPGYVYGILRRERPKRKRKPRASTSELVPKIRGMAQTIKPARIAELIGCSRAYVHKVLSETPS